jgi:alanyl-tRNA synthetase
VAARLAAQPGSRALLGTRAGGHVVFAQSAGMAGDMNALLRETVARAGGKGGGSKDFAQGTVADAARLEEILRQARERLGSASSPGAR